MAGGSLRVQSSESAHAIPFVHCEIAVTARALAGPEAVPEREGD